MSATLTAIRGSRLKLREGFRTVLILWHGAFDDDPRERQRWLAGQVPSSAANVAAVHLFGTDLLTVRIDLHARSSRGFAEAEFGAGLRADRSEFTADFRQATGSRVRRCCSVRGTAANFCTLFHVRNTSWEKSTASGTDGVDGVAQCSPLPLLLG